MAGQPPAEADAEHVDVIAVALGRDDELGPVRGKQAAEDPVALDGAAVQRVEHVDQVTVDGYADRERAARAQHLAERQLVAARGEDRDRVAARVHGEEQGVPRVVGQRALGGGVVRC